MLTLLKFYADWCGPCKNMAPIIDQLVKEDDALVISAINIDDNPQLRVEYNIRSIPAFVLVEDGKEVGRKVGSGTLSEMKEFVDEHRGL